MISYSLLSLPVSPSNSVFQSQERVHNDVCECVDISCVGGIMIGATAVVFATDLEGVILQGC